MAELSEQSNKVYINKLKSAFPPVYSIILGILASAICGFMLAKTFFYESRILILVFYTILFGFLSGASISYGVKRNKYKKKLTIFFLIMLCSFLTYLIFSFSFIFIGLPRYPISFYVYLERIICWWPLEYNKTGESYFVIDPAIHIIEPSTPSTTFPPAYYKKISSQILQKRIEWVKELGLEPGTKKTVDWLNNKLPEEPLPDSIAGAIDGVMLYSPSSMDFTLKNNFRYTIYRNRFSYSDTRTFVPIANITILLTMFSMTIYCAWMYIIITCPWLSSEEKTGWFQSIIKKLQRRFN